VQLELVMETGQGKVYELERGQSGQSLSRISRQILYYLNKLNMSLRSVFNTL
jgi:hypothetical protein